MKVEHKKYFDYGQKATDLELNSLELRLKKEYAQASKEVQTKLEKHLENFAKKDEAKRKLLDAGKLSKDDYTKWRQGQLYASARWSELSTSLAQDYVNTNKITAQMITHNNYDVFALGHNYAAFDVDSTIKTGTSWTLYNRQAVENLVKGNRDLPLVTKMDIPKDFQWNKKQIESAMTQGILQGESIPDIAKRLPRAIGEKNLNGAIRRARTLATYAENAGRLDAYREVEPRANALGFKMQKCWISTIDNVTRDSHVDLFGECVDLDKTFSNGLDAPGGSGPPEEVYNCRCCIITQIEGFEHDLSFADEWKLERQREDFEEWQEEQNKVEISKGIFNSEIDERVNAELAKMSNEDAERWKRQIESSEYKIQNDESPHYNKYTNKITLNSDTEGWTVIHENAHHFDYNNTINYTDRWTVTKRGITKEYTYDYGACRPHDILSIKETDIKAQDDYYSLANKIGLSLNKDGTLNSNNVFVEYNTWAKRVRSDLGIDEDAFAAVSDIISSKTLDGCGESILHGGHTSGYWQDMENVYTENWADYCYLRATQNDKAIKLLEDLMPSKMNDLREVYDLFWTIKK